MSTKELIKEIEKLPISKRKVFLEKALRSIREKKDLDLKKAARIMASEYKTNKELTAFTLLDSEPFYETR